MRVLFAIERRVDGSGEAHTKKKSQPAKSRAATCPSSNSARSGQASFIISTIHGILVLAKMLMKNNQMANARGSKQ